jgi:hypothetical protein
VDGVAAPWLCGTWGWASECRCSSDGWGRWVGLDVLGTRPTSGDVRGDRSLATARGYTGDAATDDCRDGVDVDDEVDGDDVVDSGASEGSA